MESCSTAESLLAETQKGTKERDRRQTLETNQYAAPQAAPRPDTEILHGTLLSFVRTSDGDKALPH